MAEGDRARHLGGESEVEGSVGPSLAVFARTIAVEVSGPEMPGADAAGVEEFDGDAFRGSGAAPARRARSSAST